MTDNPFYRLAPFIQEHIYRQGWNNLRSIQVRAIEGVFDTRNHLLITSGTASGKTEAAFLPIITDLHNNPSATIGAMYVGPLKALINDQFERLDLLLQESNIPVQSWHGDVTQSKKTKFLKQAQGILQITPESLEAMLIHRHVELGRLFGELRYVVIDEVHAFIDSDRGRQVLCQLQRLARYQQTPARRIGLSATIGEPKLAMDWLKSGTDFETELIEDENKSRGVALGLEYFSKLPNDFEKIKQRALKSGDQKTLDTLDDLEENHEAFFDHMYRLSKKETKTLIFGNSRGDVEEIIGSLRRIAKLQNTPNIYHAHHGSTSAPLRETAETEMKAEGKPACTAATVTLELGIDIGNLDQVFQVNATHSVSSFVQRLGRSGRRGGAAHMFFYSREQVPLDNATLGERIPWNLIQTIAIIQLFIEEKWIEPPIIPHYPFSLLYHQTMSTLCATTELFPNLLADRILTLPPFANITQEQFREFLLHLINIKHLEQMETGTLIIGLEGEKVVNNYRFYATFQTEIEFQVRDSSKEIGTIQAAPAVGDTIALAGYSWKVNDIDIDKRIIYVDRVSGRAPTLWMGGGGWLHKHILERMLQVLQEEHNYGYLHERAIERLNSARMLAYNTNLSENQIIPLGGNKYMILPWLGTHTFRTLAIILSKYFKLSFNVRCQKFLEKESRSS